MKIINANTKKGKNMLHYAVNGPWYADLGDCYGRCSDAKKLAFRDCYNACQRESGINFHIFSYNSNFFSVSWEITDGVRIETAYNSYLITETPWKFR